MGSNAIQTLKSQVKWRFHTKLPVHLTVGHAVPPKVHLPVEAAPGHVGRGHVLEAVVRDDVDDGANDRLPVPGNLVQQRDEPPLGALAVGVQERDHLPLDVLGAEQPGANEAGPRARSQDLEGWGGLKQMNFSF